MTLNTVTTTATKTDVRRAVARAATSMSRGGAQTDAVMTRVGLAILGRIKQAFIVKARGGTDEAGDSWKPLSPKTIAYSKTRQRGRGGRTRTEKKRDAFPSQALNKKQQDRWWEVYRRNLARFKGDKRHAAAAAWLVLKAEGAQTLLDKYGGRQVEILRDTGLLFNSLSPGVRVPHQVFRTEPGAVVVGTNRKGAKQHHEGVPGRLPQRRLWPPVSRWPKAWWGDIIDAVKQGIVDQALQIIKGIK